MAVIPSLNSAQPIAIANGGTNATSMATADGVVYFDGTRLVTTSAGTAGNVLTSNGPGVAPTYQAGSGGGGITQLNGTTGSATPSAGIVTIAAGAGITSVASGSTVTITATGSGGGVAGTYGFVYNASTGSLSQTITNSTPYLGQWVVLTLNYDTTGGAFYAGGGNTGSPARFTAPATGIYSFTMSTLLLSTVTGSGTPSLAFGAQAQSSYAGNLNTQINPNSLITATGGVPTANITQTQVLYLTAGTVVQFLLSPGASQSVTIGTLTGGDTVITGYRLA